MTISQANAVNRLCDFLLGEEPQRASTDKVTEAEAKEALAELADHANKALYAGWRGDDVRREWRRNVKGGAGRFRRSI